MVLHQHINMNVSMLRTVRLLGRTSVVSVKSAQTSAAISCVACRYIHMSTRVQASKSNDDAVVVMGKGKQRHSDDAVDDTSTESTSSTQNLEKDRRSNDAIVINQAFKKLTQRERDELLMAKMKERMSGEGDERAFLPARDEGSG